MKDKSLYINKKFNKLIIIALTSDGKHIRALVKCDCAHHSEIKLYRVLYNITKSCGCLKGESHGYTKGVDRNYLPSTYRVWQNMKQRCYNTNATGYEHWGGRGIKVCDKWKNSFTEFLKDMGEKPKGKSLDRIDFNGNYELSNCRWATAKQQNNNSRINIKQAA